MKHIVTLIVIMLSFYSCKIQSQIIEIDKWSDEQQGVYYKDLNNQMDAFEGTWIYANGNTSLKIVLVKKTMCYNGDYYLDLMVGEYQYIEDGVEIINTLEDLGIEESYNNSITGSSIHTDCRFNPSADCTD